MTNDASRSRIRELGDRALELDEGGERDAFIARVCGDNQELKASVTRYVSGADDPLFDPIPPSPGMLKTSEQIGRWTLEEKIGEGGLGVVYRAARSDGEVRQRGAIKFLRGRFHSSDLEIRFRDERQILANLNHPYIVGLIDGGVTADNQPYLVMQLVENGEPLDVYCRKRWCSLNQSLVLFQKICEAVSYAHKKMVVHRDLKPGNILVTPDGTPHLLDFGVAKILDPMHRAGAEAAHSSHVLLGTERYFSPEQARLEPLDQSTDIYSLGVILYELLTGTDPYDFERRVQQSIQEIVCKVDPELPSRAVERRRASETTPATEPDAPGSPISAERRRELAGDIDAILIQALRKERARRYPSVDDFSADIQRHLGHLPVKARLNRVSYRASRFVRRNRPWVFASSVIVALALILLSLATARIRRLVHEADAENVRALTDQSGELLGGDPGRALQLAVEAVESTFNKQHYALPVAENALHLALRRSHHRWRMSGARLSDAFTNPRWIRPGGENGNGLALSPDGGRLAVADESSIVIWDVESNRSVFEVNAHGAVSGIVFSPHGARLAAATAAGGATVWDLKSGREIRSFRPRAGAEAAVTQVSHRPPDDAGTFRPPPGPVTAPVFSPDGMLLATFAEEIIEIRDVESGRHLLGLRAKLWPGHTVREQNLFVPQQADAPDSRMPGPPAAEPRVAFSWDVAAGGRGRHILIASIEGLGSEKWNVDSGIRTFQMLVNSGGMSVRNQGSASRGIQMFWSPDGRMFATIEGRFVTLWISYTGSAGGARTWLAEDGMRFREWRIWAGSVPVLWVDFGGHDGEHLTVYAEDHSIKAFDLQTNTELLSLRADNAAFNADGTRIVTASAGGPIEVWEPRPETEVAYLPSPVEAGNRMALSPDGSRLATILPNRGRIAIWDANTGRSLNTLGPEDGHYVALAFNRAGTRVVSVDLDGHVITTNAMTAEGSDLGELRTDTFPPSMPFNPISSTIAFNRDATRVLVVDRNGRLEIWNSETGARVVASDGIKNPAPYGNERNSAVFTRDGSRVATAANGVASIRNSVSGARILSVPAGAISSLAFGADGKHLAIGQTDGKVSVIDALSGNLLYSVVVERAAAIESLAFSPVGDRLAAGDADGQVKILEAMSGTELLNLSPAPRFLRSPSDTAPPPDAVRCLLFVPNGKHLVIGSDSGVRVVTLDTTELLRLAHVLMAEAN